MARPEHPPLGAAGQQLRPTAGRQHHQIRGAAHPQHPIPSQTQQGRCGSGERRQTLALNRHQVAGGQGKTQQLNRIAVTAWEPGVLQVVGAHRHRDPRPLQAANRRLGPQHRRLAWATAQQPLVGERQGHHPQASGGHLVG